MEKQHNPDPDYNFKEGNADCVQTLVKAGANVNSSNARWEKTFACEMKKKSNFKCHENFIFDIFAK